MQHAVEKIPAQSPVKAPLSCGPNEDQKANAVMDTMAAAKCVSKADHATVVLPDEINRLALGCVLTFGSIW
jgi:hypothetical protein